MFFWEGIIIKYLLPPDRAPTILSESNLSHWVGVTYRAWVEVTYRAWVGVTEHRWGLLTEHGWWLLTEHGWGLFIEVCVTPKQLHHWKVPLPAWVKMTYPQLHRRVCHPSVHPLHFVSHQRPQNSWAELHTPVRCPDSQTRI